MISMTRPMTRPIVTIVLAFVLFACGASAREKTIHATYVATVTAQKGFQAFEKQHEANIVASSRETGYEAGKAALAAYREKSDRVTELFAGVWRALAAAAVLNEDPKAFANLVEAWTLLQQALRDLSGGKLP